MNDHEALEHYARQERTIKELRFKLLALRVGALLLYATAVICTAVFIRDIKVVGGVNILITIIFMAVMAFTAE